MCARVLRCLIKPILGNRYGPGILIPSRASRRGQFPNTILPFFDSSTFYPTLFFFGLEFTQIACRVQQERAQVEAQDWGNSKVARLEDTPTILF